MNEKNSNLILLSDIIEQKVRKEKELEFYQTELAKLQEKMYWLRRDIEVNSIIIEMIQNETVLDIAANINTRLIEEEP